MSTPSARNAGKPEFGIYDTKDDCWLGDDAGPKKFDNFMVARIAAQIYEDQVCGSDLGGRFEAREIPDGAFGLKDTVEVRRNTLASLQRIEGRKQ